MPQRGAAEERRHTPEGGSRPSSARPVPPFEADAASHPYGLNNEQLPERLQEALRRLVFQYSYESESTRRHEIRRIKQAAPELVGLLDAANFLASCGFRFEGILKYEAAQSLL